MEKREPMKKGNNDNRWLEEIHDKMMNFQADVPADGWKELESALFPKIRPWKTIWSAAASIVILLLGIGLLTLTPSNIYDTETNSQDLQQANSMTIDTEKIKESPANVNDYFARKPIKDIVSSNNLKRNKKSSDSVAAVDTMETSEATEIDSSLPLNENDEVALTDVSEATDSTIKETQLPNNFEDKQLFALLDSAENPADNKANKQHKWSIGALFEGKGMFDFNSTDKGMPGQAASAQPVDSIHNYDNKEMTRGGEIYLPQSPQSPILDAKNHRSWSFGVSVQKEISTHLAIESGLVYTLLTSDIVIQANNNAKEVSQSLHYLGIPLKLNYLFANPQNWNFYAGAGVMLEYCVGGNRNSVSLSISDRWQWSAKANLGVQYNFSKLVGIYLEPGVNYFFSPNKTIPTLRTQQPFSFNLNAGIRFNIK